MIVGLAEESLVVTIEVDDPALHDPLARRTALMGAMVPVGVIIALVAVNPDLEPVLSEDADIAILHFNVLAHENLLRHPASGSLSAADEFSPY
jgi:hypothetical protein